MLHINSFGKLLVIDRSNNVVIAVFKSHELAKFVSGTILDTYVIQVGDWLTNTINPDWLTDKCWVKYHARVFTEYTEITEDLRAKRDWARLRARGYWILLEQATILEHSYNNLSDLNIEDLTYYNLFRKEFIEKHSVSTGMSLLESEKHLDFLADSLKSLHFRKQTLIWKYSRSLKDIKTESEFIIWRDSVLNETVGIGQV